MNPLLSYFINTLISTMEKDYGIPISEISYQINRATRGLNMLVASIQLVLFLVICFFGYRLLKKIITVAGALMGFIIGAIAGILLVDLFRFEPWTILVTAFGFMLLFGFLAFKLYRLGIFLHYFLSGTLMFGVILAVFGVNSIWVVLGVAAGFGIVLGILSLIYSKMYIIISSAIMGGLNAGAAVCVLIENYKDGVKILIGLILALLGALYQLWYENKKTNTVKETNNHTSEGCIAVTKEMIGAKIICAKCGVQLNGISKFCPECGNSLYSLDKHIEKKRDFCQTCGARIMDHSKFCIKCGSKV